MAQTQHYDINVDMQEFVHHVKATVSNAAISQDLQNVDNLDLAWWTLLTNFMLISFTGFYSCMLYLLIYRLLEFYACC